MFHQWDFLVLLVCYLVHQPCQQHGKINSVAICLTSNHSFPGLEGNIPSTSPRGPYIQRGDLTEGFFALPWFGGLIFGGTYAWRGSFSEFLFLYFSPYERKSKTVLDSGFHAVDSGSFVSTTWIPDSNRQWDFRFLELYSGFQSPGFRITLVKISRIPESGFPYTW